VAAEEHWRAAAAGGDPARGRALFADPKGRSRLRPPHLARLGRRPQGPGRPRARLV